MSIFMSILIKFMFRKIKLATVNTENDDDGFDQVLAMAQ